MKPKQEYCRMYCKDVATCTRTQCSRSPLFLYGVKTVMAEPSRTDPVTKRIKKRIRDEDRLKIRGFNY